MLLYHLLVFRDWGCKNESSEFSGGPVVGTLLFTAEGLSSVPAQGTRIPQATAKKKRKKWMKSVPVFKEFKWWSVGRECQIFYIAAATAKSLQSCPTLCDPIDSSPPGSAVPGVLQARTLDWAAISFSNALKWKMKVKTLSRVRLCATPWTAAHQAPPSMGFSRQECWSGVPLPSLTWYYSPSQFGLATFQVLNSHR